MATPILPPPKWDEIEALPEFQEANANTRLNLLTKWKRDAEAFIGTDPSVYEQAKPLIDDFYQKKTRDFSGQTVMGSAVENASTLTNIANTIVGRGLSSIYRGVGGAAEMASGFAEQFNESEIKQRIASVFPEQTRQELFDIRGIEAFANYAANARATGKALEEAFPADQSFAQSIPGQILAGFADVPGQLGPYAIPGVGPITAFGAIYEEQYRERYADAIANGATEQEARTIAHGSAAATMPAGALDYLSDKLVIGKILEPLKGKVTLRDLAKTFALTGAAGGVVEGLQTGWQNFEAKYLGGWDPDRPITQGVVDSIIVGAVVDSVLSTGGQAATSALAPETAPTATPATTTPDAPTPITVDAILDEAGFVDPDKLAAMSEADLVSLRDNPQTGPEAKRLVERAIQDRFPSAPTTPAIDTESGLEQAVEGEGDIIADFNLTRPTVNPEAILSAPQEEALNAAVAQREVEDVASPQDQLLGEEEAQVAEQVPAQVEQAEEVAPDEATPTPPVTGTTEQAPIQPGQEAVVQDAGTVAEAGQPAATKEVTPVVTSRATMGKSPKAYEVLEKLPPQKGDLPGEEYYRIRDEKTGEEQIVEKGNLKLVKGSQLPTGPAQPQAAPTQEALAQGLQDLLPQLIARAARAGVQDAEMVASKAVQMAIAPTKKRGLPTLEEARKFANSTAIKRAIADALREQLAQKRGSGQVGESLEQRAEAGMEAAQEGITPAEEVMLAEERERRAQTVNAWMASLPPAMQEAAQSLMVAGSGVKVSRGMRNKLEKSLSKWLMERKADLPSPSVVLAAPKDTAPEGWTPTERSTQNALKREYQTDQGVTEVLRHIAKNSKSTAHAMVASALLRRVSGNLQLNIFQPSTYHGYAGMFFYDEGKPTVRINMANIADADQFETTFLHEVVHATTYQFIEFMRTAPWLATAQQRQIYSELIQNLEDARALILGDRQQVEAFLAQANSIDFFTGENRNLYGLSNIHEFATELMTNPNFIKKLDGLRVRKGQPSLFRKFVESILRMFGIEPTSPAAGAMENIIRAMDENKVIQQRGQSRLFAPAFDTQGADEFQSLNTKLLNAIGAAMDSFVPTVKAQDFEADPRQASRKLASEKRKALMDAFKLLPKQDVERYKAILRERNDLANKDARARFESLPEAMRAGRSFEPEAYVDPSPAEIANGLFQAYNMRKNFGSMRSQAPMAPAMLAPAPGVVTKPTQSIQNYLEKLTPKVRDYLKGTKYEVSSTKADYEVAIATVADWKTQGLNAQQMVDRMLDMTRLSPQSLFSGRADMANERQALAVADVLNAELNGMASAAAQAQDSAQEQFVVEEQIRLNNAIMSAGTTAGKALQFFSVLAKNNLPGTYLRQAQNLFEQIHEKKLPPKIKQQSRETVDVINSENEKIVRSRPIKEKISGTTERVSKNKAVSLARSAKKLLEKLKKAKHTMAIDAAASKADLLWALKNGSINVNSLTAEQRAKLTELELERAAQEEAARAQQQYPVKDAYEDMLAKAVADDVVGKFVESPEKARPPLEEFYARLKKAIKKNLPEIAKEESAKPTQSERLAEEIEFLVRNRSIIADQMVVVREQLHRERVVLGLSDEMLASLDSYIDQITDPKIESIDFTSYVREEVKGMRALIESHYAAPDYTVSTLTDKLLAQMPWLSFEDASAIAVAVEREFFKQADEVKQRALESAFKKQHVPESKRKTLADKIIRMSNLGALDENKYLAAMAEVFDIPTLTPEFAARIQRQANAIQDMKPGRAKEKATQDLYNLIADQKDVSFIELWTGFWKGGIFGTWGGQAMNALGGILRYQPEILAFAGMEATKTANPKAFWDIYVRAWTGYLNAIPSAYNILKSGDYSGQGEFEAAVAQMPWERIRRNPEKHGTFKNLLSNIVYVSRFMAAMDVINSGFGKEGRLRLAAWQWKNGQPSLSQGAYNKGMDELSLVGRSPQQQQFAQQQATDEGLKRNGTVQERVAYWQRVNDILDENADEAARQEAAQYHRQASLQGETYGVTGFIVDVLSFARKVPGFGSIVDFIFPVIRTMGNLNNDWLNYTPVGIYRLGESQMPALAEKLESMAPSRATRAIREYFPNTPEDVRRSMMLEPSATANDIALFRAKVFFGNFILSSLLTMLVWRPWDEDDEEKKKWNTIDVVGPRPRNNDIASAAERAGVKWNSVKIGDTYANYEFSTLYLVLSMIGTVRNSQVYRQWDKKTQAEYATAMSMSVVQSMANVRVLDSGVSFLAAITGNAPSEKSAMRTVVRQISGILVPIPGFVREAEQVVSRDRPETNDISDYFWANLPVSRSIMSRTQPKLDYFGRPVDVGNPLTRRFWSKRDRSPEGMVLEHILNEGLIPPSSALPTIQVYNPKSQKPEKIQYSPDQEYFFQQKWGESMQRKFRESMSNPESSWLNLRGEALERALDSARDAARMEASAALRQEFKLGQ